MQNKKIVKVTEPVIRLAGIRTVGVIGDPGCEGLGTYNMKVYAGALEESSREDITLIVGDLVPTGTNNYYSAIAKITESLAGNDVYTLRGNHDTGAYCEYFGRKNYAIVTEDFAVVVLDNAARTFEQEGLSLLREILAMDEVDQVIVAFHIPVPNHFILNCVSEEEFLRLKEVYAPWKEKVKYLLCGHVHSRFVDEVDGITLICTGGGGAMIEDVSKEIRACDVEHHIVRFYVENRKLKYQIKDLAEECYGRERNDAVLEQKLKEAVSGELTAHFQYMMFADRAERRGLERVSNLFRALAASEYYHARNFYSIVDCPDPFLKSVQTFIPGERFEYEYLYKMLKEYAAANEYPLAAQAYAAAAGAEKEHEKLLKQAADPEAFEKEKLYVCPICGHIMTEEEKKERCPVCGGPDRQFEKFSVNR